MSLNNVQLVGHIARAHHQITNGNAVSMLTIAVSRNYANKETGEYDADFIQVKAFARTDKQREYFESLVKGTLVTVEGSIRTSQYEKDGQTIYSQDIIVDQINRLRNPKPAEEAAE